MCIQLWVGHLALTLTIDYFLGIVIRLCFYSRNCCECSVDDLCEYMVPFIYVQRQEEGDEPFGLYDMRYYIRKSEEADFNVDYETVKQYFPLNIVTAGLLQIYQDLLGMTLSPCFHFCLFSSRSVYVYVHVSKPQYTTLFKLFCSCSCGRISLFIPFL